MIPEEIAQVISRFQVPSFPVIESPEVLVGDLRYARPADGGTSRLVLVLAPNDSESVQVALVHSSVELATSRDLVVPAGVASVAYDLVIETDLIGVVWTADLGQRVGHVPRAVVHVCVTGDLADDIPQVYFGHALAGSLDIRWRFKEAEGDELEMLSADCTATLIEGKSWWRLDVGSVLPLLIQHAPDADKIMDELISMWLRLGDQLVVAPADLVELQRLGLVERDVWVERRTEHIGGTFFDSFLAPFADLTTQSDRPGPSRGEKVQIVGRSQLLATA